MKSIVLNNGIKMPVLGFGTFLMGGAECEHSVLSAIEAGYRLIDTAEAYGNEDAVGAAITKCGVARGDLFLSAKEMEQLQEMDTAVPMIGDPENPEKVEMAMTW